MNIELLSGLFGGREKYLTLKVLFESPTHRFSVTEVATAANTDRSNVSRWLSSWAQLGLLEREEIGARPVYRVSNDPELLALVPFFQQGSQTTRALKERLEEISSNVEAAVIFGSTAKGTAHKDSDIDVLLITSLSRLETQAHFKATGRTLGKPVNVLVFTPEDWKAEVDRRNPLVMDILNNQTVSLKGALYGASTT